MHKYAFYLPQFHEIPENNEWWGQGFTEWTNVKKAKPLFVGHKQPIHPENDYYYNLLDKSAVEWQTKLLEKYHVDGFIYYHYYFCGKMLLEKPAENLLKWKDIPQKFFFCWANHDWNRAWNGSKEVLQEQIYGDVNDWEQHFKYLLNFFKDDRYLKIDNKPVFMLFKSVFDEKQAMMNFFNRRCIEEGFDGLFLIETYNGGRKRINLLNEESGDYTKKIFVRQPTVARQIMWKSKSKKIRIQKAIYDYKKKHRGQALWKTNGDDILNYLGKGMHGEQYIHGMFFSFDNTPRHGMRGEIIKSVSKEGFMKAMDKLAKEDFIFFNAWNEWAEGMVMEPTRELGDSYLSWIKEWSERENR